MRKEEITIIEFCVKVSISARMGGIGFSILTRTESGIRYVPMIEEVAVCFHRIIANREVPKVTPHVCRHTFCSNMAKSGMNPKTLQYIMGYSDISVTLNTYTHVNFYDTKEELHQVANA